MPMWRNSHSKGWYASRNIEWQIMRVEYGFTPNWTAAFEYDRLFMGGKNVTYIGPAGIAFANKQLTRDVDLFTVRVNYKFGSQEVARF